MNLLTALLTGRRENLTPKKIKLDAYLVTALVVLLAVFGTVLHNLNNHGRTPQSATATSEEIEANTPAPSSEPSFSVTEFPFAPSKEQSPESPRLSDIIKETPRPAQSREQEAAADTTDEEGSTSELQIIRESQVVRNETGPISSSPVKTPNSPTSSAPPSAEAPATTAPVPAKPPAVTPPPVAVPVTPPAPVAPPVTNSPYPVSAIPAAAYKTTIHLNLRSGPGAEYGVIGDGTTGTTVNGTGRASGIWYEVQLNGKTGWMSSQYLQKIETGANSVASLQAFAGSRLGNDSQLQCLITLWHRESNWNYTAINPSYAPNKPATPTYQAYGIAQAAPGSKMATFGTDWETNPRTQILWGLDYIAQRYGAPCNALDHSYKVGWY